MTGQKGQVNKRNAGFELLRILCMLMVLLLHYNTGVGALADAGHVMTPVRIAGGLTESFAIVAVNVYVLISGYFLSQVPFRAKRIVTLWLQTVLYTALIPAVILLAGGTVKGDSIWTGITYLFPIQTEHYWFVSAYMVLFILSPVLNAAIAHLEQKQLQITIALLLVHFCLIKSISPFQLVMDRMGYDFGWFLCLYLIAGYIRKYGIRLGKNAALVVYLLSSGVTFLLYLLLHLVSEKTGGLQYFAGVMFHYNFLPCLAGSIGLFCFFKDMELPEGRFADLVRRIGPLTFGVYLIHQQIDLKEKWYLWTQKVTGAATQTQPLLYVLQALLAVLLTFAVCACIDAVRKTIFDKIADRLR